MSVVDQKEKLLLEFVFSNKDIFIKVSKILECKYFDNPLDITLKFVNEYFNEYHSLPSMDVIFAETEIKLAERSIDPSDDSEIKYVVNEIEKHCQHAAMRLAILDSVDEDLPNGDFASIEDRIRKALMVSIDTSMGIDLFDDPEARLLAMQETGEMRSIGWPKMDQLIGNIRRGELFITTGGTAAGKSIVLANIGNNLAKDGLNTLYITLELADSLVAKRLDSIVTGIPSKLVFDNIDDVVVELSKAEKGYGSFYVKKMPNRTKAAHIRSYLMEYHLQFGYYPDVLCVDYLDLMAPNGKVEGGRFEIDKAIAEELREIFIDFNLYGFTASQLNRDSVGTTEKTQAHIAGGISKLNTADVAIAINRDDTLIDNHEIQFQVMKLRNAESSSAPLTFCMNAKTLRITEEPELASYMETGKNNDSVAALRANAKKVTENLK